MYRTVADISADFSRAEIFNKRTKYESGHANARIDDKLPVRAILYLKKKQNSAIFLFVSEFTNLTSCKNSQNWRSSHDTSI